MIDVIDRSEVEEFVVAIIGAPSAAGDAPNIVNDGAQRWSLVEANVPVDGLDCQPARATVSPSAVTAAALERVTTNFVVWRLHLLDDGGRSTVDAAVRVCWTFGWSPNAGVAVVDRLTLGVDRCRCASAVRLDLTASTSAPRVVDVPSPHTANLPVHVRGVVTSPQGVQAIDWRLAVRGDGSTTAIVTPPVPR